VAFGEASDDANNLPTCIMQEHPSLPKLLSLNIAALLHLRLGEVRIANSADVRMPSSFQVTLAVF
jgi:hypothetical protein